MGRIFLLFFRVSFPEHISERHSTESSRTMGLNVSFLHILLLVAGVEKESVWTVLLTPEEQKEVLVLVVRLFVRS